MNVLIALIDHSGREKWARSYGAANLWEYATTASQTGDGGFIVAGQTESAGAGRYDGWILKLDENGNSETTGIFIPGEKYPERLLLAQNYPNPFCLSTTISLYLPEPGFVSLTVYDLTGRVVDTLFKGDHPRGELTIHWIPKNLKCGHYLYRAEFNNKVENRALLLIKP